MKKAYCKECKYFFLGNGLTDSWLGDCKHPDNLVKYDTYYTVRIRYKSTPNQLNKNNHCTRFKSVISYESKGGDLWG